MKRIQVVLIVLITTMLLLPVIQAGPVHAQAGPTGTEFEIEIEPVSHARYGLFYPVTYVFILPAGASDLRAIYRYSTGESWQLLPEYQAGEMFSGVDAVRFDYAGRRAYVSVRFDLSSDSIFVQVLDQAGAPVEVTYDGMARYYDDRDAAVTITLDDWANYMVDAIDYASGALADLELHHTLSVLTGAVPDWGQLQVRVDSGYAEVAAHTRYHPCDADAYQTYGGYDTQIAGSRDDLLANLTLDYAYVPAFVQPCGFEDAGVRQAVVDADFVTDRAYSTAPELGDIDYTPWSVDGAYSETLSTYLVYIWGGQWENGGSQADLDEANAAFDAAYGAGGIYHLTDHPDFSLWLGDYLPQHLDYIAGRPDVWYAGFGRMYLYHFVQERGLVTVTALPPTAVTLTRFVAEPRQDAIRLEWATATELDNLGFNVYRAESLEGARVRLNDDLIPSRVPPGSLVGADYELWDMTAEPNVTYYYWLEDLDVYGWRTVHDPVRATLHPRMLPGWGIRRISP